MIAVNGILAILAAPNLSDNVFALKATEFYDLRVYALDLPQRLLLYSPLLIPLWLWILRRRGHRLNRKVAVAAVLFFAISFVTNLPFAHVDLTNPLPLRYIYQLGLIFGLARPAATFFFFYGCWLLFMDGEQDGTRPGAASNNVLSFTGVLLGAYAIALLARPLLFGPALPRLEDEIAYHLQALLFADGRLTAHVPALSGVSTAGLEQLIHVPYLIVNPAPDGGVSYYSAHLHGWSFVLAGLSFVGLAPYGTLLLTSANTALLLLAVRTFFPRSGSALRDATVLLWITSPVVFFLASTYMAHTAGATLILLTVIAWRGMSLFDEGTPGTKTAPRSLAWGGVFVFAAGALVFLRPQAGLPIMAALLAFDGYQLAARCYARIQGTNAGPETWPLPRVIGRMVFTVAVFGLGLYLFSLYSRIFTEAGESIFFTSIYMGEYFHPGCQAIGWWQDQGCFPTYGTLGHSFRKVLLVSFDALSTLNQEAAPGGVPLFAVAVLLGVRHYRRLLTPGSNELLLFLIFASVTSLYSLYFHNGGESYRGRYLTEVIFAFYLLLARLLMLEFEQKRSVLHALALPERIRTPAFSRAALVTAIFILGLNLLLMIRGGYFSMHFQPYRSVNEFTEEPVQNALISVEDLDVMIPQAAAEDGLYYYPDERRPGESRGLSLRSMRAFLNLGYPSLVATAATISEIDGLPRDRDGNVLVGPASPELLERIRERTGANPIYRMHYPVPEPTRVRRGLVYWTFYDPVLERLTKDVGAQ